MEVEDDDECANVHRGCEGYREIFGFEEREMKVSIYSKRVCNKRMGT